MKEQKEEQSVSMAVTQTTPPWSSPSPQAEPPSVSSECKQSSGDNLDAANDDDRQRVQQILAGDRLAFQSMYREYAPRLLQRLMRLTGRLDQAEDCLQQVFTEAVDKMGSYRGEGALLAWLNRIATNAVYQNFRKERRWKNALSEIWPERERLVGEAEALPDRVFLEEERRSLLHDVLKRLDSRKRMVILMCDLEGRPIEEVAKELEIPPGTVASRLHHGRLELRKRMTAELRRRGTSVEEWIHA